MKMIFYVIFSITSLLTMQRAGEFAPSRNYDWNLFLAYHDSMIRHLDAVHDFLAMHEEELNLMQVDVPTWLELDDAIKDAERMTRQLKQLKSDLRTFRQISEALLPKGLFSSPMTRDERPAFIPPLIISPEST